MLKNYIIEVGTGNIEDAGTDAGVYIQLIGGKMRSAELKLDNKENNFERGKIDKFTNVFAEDVGWINAIRMFHDNTNRHPGWYLQYVKVTDPTVGLTWQADFYCWLSNGPGDKTLDHTVDVPIGAVRLESGVIKRVYLGYIPKRIKNDQDVDLNWGETFAYQYQKGSAANYSTAISVASSAEMGASFFGADAKFTVEVSAQISKTLSSSEETTMTWTHDYQGVLLPHSSLTAVAIFYQDVLTGTAYGNGVSVEFEQKFELMYDVAFLEGWLSDAEIEEEIQSLAVESMGVRLPLPLPSKEAQFVLAERNLARVDRSSIQAARAHFPHSFIRKVVVAKAPSTSRTVTSAYDARLQKVG